MNIQTIESLPLSPTDLKDYRRRTLLGSVIALIGMFIALVVFLGIITHGREVHLVPILVAIVNPGAFVLIGLLNRRQIFTGLWGSLGTNTSAHRTIHGHGN